VRDTIPAVLSLANAVTGVRALLVAAVAGSVTRPPSPESAVTAIVLAGMATALDGVDGWLARRTNSVTPFGARFDMEVDALLILVLAVLVWQYGKAGPWILLSGLLRYLFIAAGWLLPWMRRPLRSTFRGKAICVVQIGGLMLALLPSVAAPASGIIAALSLAALCYSFFVDTLWLCRCSG
jgi:phosphatidylglycerophosphate synthase